MSVSKGDKVLTATKSGRLHRLRNPQYNCKCTNWGAFPVALGHSQLSDLGAYDGAQPLEQLLHAFPSACWLVMSIPY